MRRLLLLLVFTLLVTISYSQRLYDNGPLTGGLKYVLNDAKWNKYVLRYYIYNSSDHMTVETRQYAIDHAFTTWSDNSNLRFIRLDTPNNADLIIKWERGSHGDGEPFDGNGGILAHAFFPPPVGGTYAGHLHFDDDESWSSDGTGIDLETVALHEIGHLLGIMHSNDTTAIMYAFYSSINRSLAIDDIAAIHALYGEPLSLSGSTVICDSTLYSIENLPDALSVTWSINNSHFSLSPNGTQCTITYNDTPRYDVATLTATIMKDTLTVTTLTKRIVMHGTDMYIEGVQSGIYDENGDMPAVAATFTIPASSGMRGTSSRLSTINRDSLEMTSLSVVFENMRTITIPDNPTYGVTEIYGGADIFLDGERLDGMTISFSGDRAPEYLYSDGDRKQDSGYLLLARRCLYCTCG